MEFERPPILRQGHLFDHGVIRLDLYRLAAIFLADEAFARWEATTGDAAVAELRQTVEDEISRILMTAAIAIRIIDDRDGPYIDERTGACGTLQSNRALAAQEPLSLRTACNKIVHAQRINFDLSGDPLRTDGIHLLPTIYLYGELGGREWRAALNVLDFAKEARRVV